MKSPRNWACPIHKCALGPDLFCPECAQGFVQSRGIPVLLNESRSVFRTADYVKDAGYGGASDYGGSLDHTQGLRQFYRRAMHALMESGPARHFGAVQAVSAVLAEKPDAEILVIGAGDTSLPGQVTYTDVAFGANVHCIADAHDLPFLAASFDACVAVAVLEHVADPYRCVDEMRRVLRPGGWVYAATPFMQPVHMGAHDFTRFTFLGHRRLFRHFDEVRSGIEGGPGTSAGQALRSLIAALSDRPAIRRWLKLFGLLATYPFKWLDPLTSNKHAAYDAASGFYFFGRLRAADPISDRDILELYRGS